jgi:hypothetical protein
MALSYINSGPFNIDIYPDKPGYAFAVDAIKQGHVV